jgi:hypothetical protein
VDRTSVAGGSDEVVQMRMRDSEDREGLKELVDGGGRDRDVRELRELRAGNIISPIFTC